MTSRSQQAEAGEDIGTNQSTSRTIGDIISARLNRRDLGIGLLTTAVINAVVLPRLDGLAETAQAAEGTPSAAPATFNFTELAAGVDETHHVADGYDAQVLIRWGDKVLADAPGFTPAAQTAAAQAKQFGYNNDFIGYFPIDGRSDHGLMVVNHEYTIDDLMVPAAQRPTPTDSDPYVGLTADLVGIEMMAHGGSVIEVKREGGTWSVVSPSQFARRITAETEVRLSGPAAGHDRLKTSADPTGTRVAGMLNNCAGATTPWGTWLTCEENFNGNFFNKAALAAREDKYTYGRYGVPSEWYGWGKFHDRFDVGKEPNEPHRFGWVVEIDPFDPQSVPVKRTAMGRFKHEGAGNIVNKDGRFVVYQGDDERFEYFYKFVTEGKVDIANKAANRDLLDKGTLYVARFNDDGTGEWLPLVQGIGPLRPEVGFHSQADVLIWARIAADYVSATRMDRPEDADVNPATGKVYLMLTNNSKRSSGDVNAANPRAENAFGHIIELTPHDGDHASPRFTWEILVRCGNPAVAGVGALFNPATTDNGWFGMPDNCVVDPDNRLWIATDGNSKSRTGRTDGVWAMETDGAARGTSKLFFRVPIGAEMCGPAFTPDMETFFVAVQHPGDTDSDDKSAPKSTYEQPLTRWPDFKPDMPPRPSIVAITKKGGGKIGV